MMTNLHNGDNRMEGSDWSSKPRHGRHTMLIVPKQSAGVTVERALEVL
jgi:hypothetical protein